MSAVLPSLCAPRREGRLAASSPVATRAESLYQATTQQHAARTDRMFVGLMLFQWVLGVMLAVLARAPNEDPQPRVLLALLAGVLLAGGPALLARLRPGESITRQAIAVAQLLWSGLLIQLTGGHSESHFHVFGSLAFLAVYRDCRVLGLATLTLAVDHGLRSALWPHTLYEVVDPWPWRFLEHVGWVLFADVFLILACRQQVQDLWEGCLRQAEVELLGVREQEKGQALNETLKELHGSQEALVRTEKLAAVGQLAASVGHELRNPLSAIRNAATFVARKLEKDGNADPKVTQFLGIIQREVDVCTGIVSDLLDFARERPPQRHPCPLRPLVEEAISVVEPGRARIVNDIPESLPVPPLDREQFRQVFINLVQNAVEAVGEDRGDGLVRATASGGGEVPWVVSVEDNGSGIPPELQARIFEPLFTTRRKGTGLGLAVVQNLVRAHGGRVWVESRMGQGSRFVIELPPAANSAAG